MKKIIFNSLIIALLGVAFNSCNKDSKLTEVAKFNNSNLITQTTSNYINEQSKFPSTKISPFWCRVIGADCTGAGAGVIAGGTAGSLIGGIGAVPGAIIGGILGGAGASFTTAGREGITAKPGGNSGSSNSNNPYDFMGALHYDIVNIMLNNKNEYFPNNNLNYAKYEELVFAQLKVKYQDCDDKKASFPADFYSSEILFHANRTEDIVSYFSIDNPRISGMSNNVRLIIQDFSRAIQETTNKSDFIKYSISCENIIVNSCLNNYDKMQILSYMATARYGISYYL